MACTYYASIDGLRGLAVLAVFAFHLDLSGCEGGYLGVDIFFLISGFIVSTVTMRRIRNSPRKQTQSLPSSDLVRGKNRKSFDWVDFSLRRAKRLWPELFLVMTATLVVGAKLSWESEFERFPISSLAQVFLVSNFRFWQEAGDYFDPGSKAKPFLHTWSLSLEEQFYLFFAAALTFGYGKISKQGALRALIAIWMVSLAGSVKYAATMQSSVFYLLPFRAWQFLSGIIPAIISDSADTRALPKYLWKLRKYFPGTTELLCLMGILCAIGFEPFLQQISPTLPAALCVGLGALLLPSLVISRDCGKLTWTGRLLALKPIVFIGEISYSIYLWHWPIICFGSVAIEDNGFQVKSAILCLTCILATFSHHFLVSPIRSIANSNIRGSRTFLALLLSPVVFFVFLSFLAIFASFGRCPNFLNTGSNSVDGIEGILNYTARVSNETQSDFIAHQVPEERIINRWECPSSVPHHDGASVVTLPHSRYDCYIAFGNCSKGAVQALALGDSHLLAVGGSMQELAIEQNICLHFFSFSACPAMEGWLKKGQKIKIESACPGAISKALDVGKNLSKKFEFVFMFGRWELYLGHIVVDEPGQNYGPVTRNKLYSDITQDHRMRFKIALVNFLRKFNDLTDQFIILSQVPVRINKWNPREVYDAPFCNRETCKNYDDPDSSALAILTKELLVEVIKDWRPKVKLIDPSKLFCNQTRQTCSAYVNGALAYWDGSHLNHYGGGIMKPLLKRGFDSALSIEL